MGKAKLKDGVVLRPYGPQSSITNENLTDALASFFLVSGKARKEDFETLPEDMTPVEITPLTDPETREEKIEEKVDETKTGKPADDKKDEKKK